MSLTNTRNPVVLEPASQAVVEAIAGPPFLYELSPAEARAVLDQLQAAPIGKLPVNDRWTTVPADVGDVPVRIVRPAIAQAIVILRNALNTACAVIEKGGPVACLPSYELHRL